VRPYLEKTHHTQKKVWWSGSRCRPLLQTPVLQKKKKEREKKEEEGRRGSREEEKEEESERQHITLRES
jgi:dihydrodipicolinate reductase